MSEFISVGQIVELNGRLFDPRSLMMGASIDLGDEVKFKSLDGFYFNGEVEDINPAEWEVQVYVY